MTTSYLLGDCLKTPLPDDSVDLVFTSPPYEDARTYGIDFKASEQAWVDWALPRFMECLRVCKGIVAWVVEGRTKQYRYTATPFRLMVALQDAGAVLRKPIVYKRVGIPGSGGPDWFRNDWEPIICATKDQGRLAWSDPTACGHPPKYPPGGRPSHRTKTGKADSEYKPPSLANPGNVIECHGGGGHLGHPLAHENEAPYPLKLAEFFIKSLCPPGGMVLDPFGGSGTTAHAAFLHGRRCTLMDIRESQIELAKRRLADVKGTR